MSMPDTGELTLTPTPPPLNPKDDGANATAVACPGITKLAKIMSRIGVDSTGVEVNLLVKTTKSCYSPIVVGKAFQRLVESLGEIEVPSRCRFHPYWYRYVVEAK